MPMVEAFCILLTLHRHNFRSRSVCNNSSVTFHQYSTFSFIEDSLLLFLDSSLVVFSATFHWQSIINKLCDCIIILIIYILGWYRQSLQFMNKRISLESTDASKYYFLCNNLKKKIRSSEFHDIKKYLYIVQIFSLSFFVVSMFCTFYRTGCECYKYQQEMIIKYRSLKQNWKLREKGVCRRRRRLSATSINQHIHMRN